MNPNRLSSDTLVPGICFVISGSLVALPSESYSGWMLLRRLITHSARSSTYPAIASDRFLAKFSSPVTANTAAGAVKISASLKFTTASGPAGPPIATPATFRYSGSRTVIPAVGVNRYCPLPCVTVSPTFRATDPFSYWSCPTATSNSPNRSAARSALSLIVPCTLRFCRLNDALRFTQFNPSVNFSATATRSFRFRSASRLKPAPARLVSKFSGSV